MNNVCIKAILTVLTMALLTVSTQLQAQGVTNLLKGKVVDEKGIALKGVQVYVKSGDDIVAKSKTTSNGDFTAVLKPGATYIVSFDRYDLFASNQDFSIPASSSYKELEQSFTVRTYTKGMSLGLFQVFPAGKTTLNNTAIFETVQQMMKKMPNMTIAITVSAEGLKAPKKPKPSKKKGAVVETPITPIQQRIDAIHAKFELLSIGTSRYTILEGTVKKPSDISITITDNESGF